jgi:hypothetical protein
MAEFSAMPVVGKGRFCVVRLSDERLVGSFKQMRENGELKTTLMTP